MKVKRQKPIGVRIRELLKKEGKPLTSTQIQKKLKTSQQIVTRKLWKMRKWGEVKF